MEEKTPPVRKRRRRKARQLESVRQELGRALPTYLHEAMASYEGFLETPFPDDVKGFTAYHGACKAALAHVEVLGKLVRWCDTSSEEVSADTPSEAEEFAGLLAGARAALRELEGSV